jgi:hypothetical protein
MPDTDHGRPRFLARHVADHREPGEEPDASPGGAAGTDTPPGGVPVVAPGPPADETAPAAGTDDRSDADLAPPDADAPVGPRDEVAALVEPAAPDEPAAPNEPGGPDEPVADGQTPTVTGRETSVQGRRGRRTAVGRGGSRGGTARNVLRATPRRNRVVVHGGATLNLLVLACTRDDTTAVDLSSGALLRLRVPWPDEHEPDLEPFDVVEATLAEDPERDDLAQPEATNGTGLPRHIGTLHGRKVRRMLERLAAVPDGPILGFPGPAAPYWEFRGARPSVAVVEPTRGPQLLRRRDDDSTWVRFGWDREDVWLPVEDRHAIRALDAARRDRLAGKDLATALGFRPQYLLASISRPRDGHCYKVMTAILPRG